MARYIKVVRQITQTVYTLFDDEHYGKDTNEEEACSHEWGLEEADILESVYMDEGDVEVKTTSVEVVDKES